MKINNKNKNGKDISINYEGNNSININIFDNKILMEIAGSFDNNLKELENDYKDTIGIIEKVGFINSYSFIFSPRPGTPAAKNKLNNSEESKERLKKLQNIL